MGSEVQARVRAQAEWQIALARARMPSSAAKDRSAPARWRMRSLRIRKRSELANASIRCSGVRPAYLDCRRRDAHRASSEVMRRRAFPILSRAAITTSTWLIRRVRVLLGVAAIIYEARPNVTSDAAGLCLVGERCHSARRLGRARLELRDRLLSCACAYAAGVPEGAIQ